MINIENTPSLTWQDVATHAVNQVFETSVEGVAFLIAGMAIRIFIPAFRAPLTGIGISLITAKLVLKIIDRYDSRTVIELTKEAYKIKRQYPKLQLIAFIFALAISLLSNSLGFIVGATLGSFVAIIIDVESYIQLQHANRKIAVLS